MKDIRCVGSSAFQLFIFLCLCISAILCQAQIQSTDQPNEKAWLKYIEAHNLFREAQHKRSATLLNEAISALRETIKLDPKSSEPHTDLGEIYFLYLSQRDQAETEVNEALKLDPNNVSARLLLARMYAHKIRIDNNTSMEVLNKAIKEYEKTVELDPGSAEAWAMLSEFYDLNGEDQKEIHALQRWAVSPTPIDSYFYRWLMQGELSSDQAWFRLSQIYYRKGETRKAIDAIRHAYEADPESNAYIRSLTTILKSAGKEEELRIYAQLIKTSEAPALHLAYSSALVRSGNYNDAISELKKYLKSDNTNAGAVGLLALAQRRANQRSDAIETLRSNITTVEAHSRPDIQIMLGETYEELGRDEEALAEYDKAFKSVSAGAGNLKQINASLFGDIITRIVKVCRRTGNLAKLQSVLAEAERMAGNKSPFPTLVSVDVLREDGKKLEALKTIQQALNRMPDDRALKLTEAVVLNELKRYDDSIDSLRKMIKGTTEDATDDAFVYMLLSSSYLQKDDVINAESSVRKALDLNPDDSSISVQLSTILNRMSRFEEAEKILRFIIEQNPDNASALNNLGYFLLQRDNKSLHQEALILIERAVTIEPLNGSYLDSLGWAQYKLGQLAPARDSLKKAMVYSRSNSAIYEHLGDVNLALGETAEAKRNWEKALELSPATDEITRIKTKLRK